MNFAKLNIQANIMKCCSLFLLLLGAIAQGQVKHRNKTKTDILVSDRPDSDIQKISKSQVAKPIDTIVKTLKENEQIGLMVRTDSTMVYMVKIEENDDVFPTYILPFITLIIGALIPAFWEYFKSRNASDKVGRRWLAQVKSFNTIIGRQDSHFTELIQYERNGEYGIGNLTIFASLNAEDFATLNKDDLLNYLMSSRGMNLEQALAVSTKLIAEISIVKSLYESVKSGYDLYKSNFSAYIMSVNGRLQEIGSLLAKLQTEFEGRDNLTQPELDAMNGAFALFYTKLVDKEQSEMSNLYKLETEFFDMLITILAPLRGNNTVFTILNTIGSCKHAIRGIREEKKDMANLTEKFKQRFQEVLVSFSEIAEEMEHGEKPRRWFEFWK